MLAKVGIHDGKPFLQIRASKSGKVLVDLVVTEGLVMIRCRECLRNHRIRVGTVLHDEHPMMDLQ